MPVLKELALRGFTLAGLTRIAARCNRAHAVVLGYHGVHAGEVDPVVNFDGLHVHARRFAQQMRHVAERYDVVPLDELLNTPPRPRPGNPRVAITIDDGYQNTYRCAYPVLRRLGLPATIFVPTDFLLHGRAFWWDRLCAMIARTRRSSVRVHLHGAGRPLRLATPRDRQGALRRLKPVLRGLAPGPREDLLGHLAADLDADADAIPGCAPIEVGELAEMAADGITVGSHGCSHDSFLHLGAEELRRELIESRRVLESLTGRPVTWLSYPYGDFSPEVAGAAAAAGYRGAVTTIEGVNRGMAHPLAVRRIGVNDHMTFAQFAVAVSGLRDVLTDVRGRLSR